MNDQCARVEVLAGAIALGEATDIEREEYRNHIATCASCLRALGGEREIERVMATVAQARGEETWEPAARPIERRSHLALLRTGAAVLAAALAISFGLHVMFAGIVRPPSIEPKVAMPENARAHVAEYRVAVEPRPHVAAPPRHIAASPAPHRAIVVVHNVVTRHGGNVTQTTQTTEVAEAPAAPASNVPIWRRDEAMPQLQNAQPAPTQAAVIAGHAESIAVAPLTIVRDVVPLGGDAAIKPRPAPIAYAEDAQGTTAFEVLVDERGLPTKCTITKSSGYLVLDQAVCKAAMAARYSPRTVNGKATPGVYRDAFTFRASDDDDRQI